MDWHQVVSELVAHAAWSASILIVVIGCGYWAVTHILPRVFHASLTNGSGELIRMIIRSENEGQSTHHAEALHTAIREHEARELERWERLASQVQELGGRVVAVEQRPKTRKRKR